MKSKLTLAMLLSLSATSPMAMALGLGEADVRSTLNAPLRATIPLTDAAGMQAGLINVSVADERAFTAAGLNRSPLAASVRLAVEQQQGRLVVNLTTDRPVREPWLDLLLRFDWPDGRQLREVTLLLDPPDYDQMPVLVAGSSVSDTSASASSSSTASTDSESAPVRVNRETSSPRSTGDPAWVGNGDTLWAVAGRLRPDSGISMNQMMVALVEANPEVFPSGNINAMRAGFTLVVPNREAIAARSDAEAGRVVQAMNQAWANRGSGAPARVPIDTAPGSGAAVAQASQTRQAASAAEDPPAGEEDGVEQASEAGEEPAQDTGGSEPRLTLLTDAQVAAEGGMAASATDQDERSESGGGDAATGEGAPDDAGEPPARANLDPQVMRALYGEEWEELAGIGEGELTSDQRLVRLESRWIDQQRALTAVREERDMLQEELGDMRDELAAMRDQLAELTAGGDGVDGPGAGGVVPPGADTEEAPWWGAVYEAEVDRNLMLGGAGLAALLGAWLLVRRRRRHQESEPARGFGEVRVIAPGAQGPVSPRPFTPGQDGMASASSTSAAADTVNPAAGEPAAKDAAPVRAAMPQAEAINEADIFIAYGRFDQAGELLEASLARTPERDDLRLKLLSVYLQQGKRDAADAELDTLRSTGDPAVIDEAQRIVSRHGLGEVPAAPATDTQRAVFAEPTELPPRMFDGPEREMDSPSSFDDAQMDSPQEEPDTDPADAPYRRPATHEPPPSDAPTADEPTADASDFAADEPEPPAPDDADDHEATTGTDIESRPPAQAEPVPERQAPVSRRKASDGDDIIDYQPPSLEPAPGPRQETPQQPSVEFTSGETSGGDATSADTGDTAADESGTGLAAERFTFPTSPRGEAEGKGASREIPDDWEIEEVAFPSLDRDNARFTASTSSPGHLDEARRLIETGELGRAKSLLDELLENGDPHEREEARALISRLNA